MACTVLVATANFAFSQTAPTQKASDVKTATVKVKGVTCSSDLKTIATNVEKLKGVSSCKALKQGPTSTFEVKYNPNVIAEKGIFAAIEDTAGCENPKDRPYKIKQ